MSVFSRKGHVIHHFSRQPFMSFILMRERLLKPSDDRDGFCSLSQNFQLPCKTRTKMTFLLYQAVKLICPYAKHRLTTNGIFLNCPSKLGRENLEVQIYMKLLCKELYIIKYVYSRKFASFLAGTFPIIPASQLAARPHLCFPCPKNPQHDELEQGSCMGLGFGATRFHAQWGISLYLWLPNSLFLSPHQWDVLKGSQFGKSRCSALPRSKYTPKGGTARHCLQGH